LPAATLPEKMPKKAKAVAKKGATPVAKKEANGKSRAKRPGLPTPDGMQIDADSNTIDSSMVGLNAAIWLKHKDPVVFKMCHPSLVRALRTT